MVIVRLTGGLGNQMFQYAAARRVAFINNSLLKMDLGWFNETGQWTKRHYELGVFSLSAQEAQTDEINVLKTSRQNPFYRRLPGFLKKRVFHTNQSHIIEKDYDFDSDILSLKGSTYLDGYWQCDKYFNDIEEVIKKEFSFTNKLGQKNLSHAHLIQNSEAVSLHVRRGDYVSSQETNAYHGLCPVQYYHKAMKIIYEKIKSPVFFVFSDDIKWAESHLQIKTTTHYIDNNSSDNSYCDLQLMSLCKHHIIANSSFSWWGAWLSRNSGKIIIAPERWFNTNRQPKNNVPESWLRC